MNPTPSPRHAALALAIATVVFASAASAHRDGPWRTPQPLPFNSADTEGCPIEAPDGRSLYIASNRAGTYGNLDIFRVFRSLHGAWGMPENVGPDVNTGDADYCPTPLRGRLLMFVSSKDTETDDDPYNDDCKPGPADVPPTPGTAVAGDMYITRERWKSGWLEPLNLGCYPYGPNTPSFEFSPSLVHTRQGTFLYFSSDGYPDSQGQDIYASRVLWNGTVLPGVRVAELSTAADDRMPNVRSDGLEIVFSSTRQGFNGQDIYVAKRARTSDPWRAPVRIDNPTINTPGSETRASLSADGKRLYFGRDGDVFVSTRERLRP